MYMNYKTTNRSSQQTLVLVSSRLQLVYLYKLICPWTVSTGSRTRINVPLALYFLYKLFALVMGSLMKNSSQLSFLPLTSEDSDALQSIIFKGPAEANIYYYMPGGNLSSWILHPDPSWPSKFGLLKTVLEVPQQTFEPWIEHNTIYQLCIYFYK